MDTRQLQTLLAIAEQGNFAAAARDVNLTPSAVSQQVAALEAELGAPLFDRSKRPPTLNAKGVQLVQSARQILQILADTRAAITGARVTGTLNIGSLRTGTFTLLPRAIAGLRPQFPELNYSLQVGKSEPLMADVVSGRLDVAIVAEHVGVPRTLKWTPFLSEPLVVIAPPGTEPRPAAEWISSFPYARYKSNVPLANQIDTEISRLGISPHEFIVVDTIPAVVECVKAGLAVAVVPLIALHESGMKTLPWVPLGEPPVARQLGIVQRMNSARSDVISVLLEELVTHSAPFRTESLLR
jgi:DNA-binding transcriptional LysR family regulator